MYILVGYIVNFGYYCCPMDAISKTIYFEETPYSGTLNVFISALYLSLSSFVLGDGHGNCTLYCLFHSQFSLTLIISLPFL